MRPDMFTPTGEIVMNNRPSIALWENWNKACIFNAENKINLFFNLFLEFLFY